MRKAILLTAFNRPDYLYDVLESWKSVRGLKGWDFYISIDSEHEKVNLGVLSVSQEFQQTGLTDVYIIQHSPNLGVLRHPYVALEAMFADYDFVIRAEDDLIVSDDILEYFEQAAEQFEGIEAVKTIHGHSEEDTGESAYVSLEGRFSPWVFGTWRSRWTDLRDNWDTDYSTFNQVPGNQSGFDWNFSTRVYPGKGWLGVFPEKSRVKNIGAWGVHGTPTNLPKSPTFTQNNSTLGGLLGVRL